MVDDFDAVEREFDVFDESVEDCEEGFPEDSDGGDPDATAAPEASFDVDDPVAMPRFTVAGFVWNDSNSPSPAAVPAMTKGARFIGRTIGRQVGRLAPLQKAKASS